MSDDTWGIPVHLSCGHWIYIQRGQIPDGCVRCGKLEMKDDKDRHPWQGRR